jgi:hypothetical protein
MTEVAALLGGLRGQTPPAEFYHPAVARRKLRQELRALQDTGDPGEATAADGAAADSATPDSATPDSTAADGTAPDSTATGTAAS